MNFEPLISIIIPVYKVEKYLKECVDSVLNQTHKNLEIILVDDGSPDNCPKICDEYAKKDSRVKVVHKENGGVSSARNTGIDVSTGEFIMFFDSDDWIERDLCEKAMTTMINNNNDVVFWTYVREFQNNSSIKIIYDKDTSFGENECKNLYRRIIGPLGKELFHPENLEVLSSLWNKVYKSDIIKNNNIRFFDINKIGASEDGLFNIEYFKYVKSASYINRAFYHYRKTNENSITFNHSEDFFERWLLFFQMIYKHIQDNNLSEEFYKALDNRISLCVLQLALVAVRRNTTFSDKCKEIQKYLNNSIVETASKKLELKYFPIHWKIYFALVKIKSSFGVCFMTLIIKRITNRR